jgi:hypothetical protein
MERLVIGGEPMLPIFSNTTLLFKYWEELLAIGSIAQQVQKTGYFTQEQFKDFLDVMYSHVPEEVRAKAAKGEIIEFVEDLKNAIPYIYALWTSGTHLFIPGDQSKLKAA